MSPLPVVKQPILHQKKFGILRLEVVSVSFTLTYILHLRAMSFMLLIVKVRLKQLMRLMGKKSGKSLWLKSLAFSQVLNRHYYQRLMLGHVYVGSENAQVFALNTSDGSIAWQTTVAGEALSRPVISDGLVLIHTSNGMLQALNTTDGAISWDG
ncbi:unnamed protein product [Ranitomeya imitator]|uniref:Pyrrolo-quinoline quinone repeat domain-containing protein n=1 Tax=Ranitomeya imitator TaxID=111125 RepID=A0ABN9LPW8_9NEOB|nr:unnamed protein product [Ranitomeya imitator]